LTNFKKCVIIFKNKKEIEMQEKIKLEASTNEVIHWFQMEFPELVKSMKNADHHFDEKNLNPYHIESDVFVHTMMVCLQAQNLSPNNHHVRWAALLHDLGKPLARVVNHEKKRVAFHGHSGISTFMAVDVLNNTDLDLNDQLMIVKIVALHDSLFNFMKPDGEVKDEVKEIFKGRKTLLSNVVDHVLADSTGRFWKDDKSYANCPNDTLFQNFQTLISQLDDTIKQVRKDVPRLTLLCGPPCSGKSTYRDNYIISNPDTVVISRDDLVEAIAVKYKLKDYSDAFRFLTDNKEIEKNEVSNVIESLMKDAKDNNKSVLVDMTLMSKKSRRKWLTYFSNYSAVCVLFLKGFNKLLEHSDNREKETGKCIPKKVMIDMMTSFTLPMHSEGFDKIMYNWFDGITSNLFLD